MTAPASAPDPTRSLLTGTITRYILLAVNIGIGVFMMPFTVRHLGQAQYGLWMMVASMTYYFQLLDLGYGSGLVRQVSHADARGDVDGINRILSTFIVVYGLLGLAAGVGVLVLATSVLPRFPNLSPTDVPTAQRLLTIIGIRVVLGFPMSVFGAATTARQRFALNNGVATALAVLNGLATYVVLESGHGLVTLVATTTTLSVAGYGAYVWTARRAFPEMRIHPSEFSRGIVREVSAFSFYFFLIDIAVQIGFNLDNVVIGAFLGTSSVALYAVALRLADYQRQLCNQFNGLLFPVVVRLGASGRQDGLRTTLVEGTRIALILVVGVSLCLLGFSGPLVTRWMGPGFAGSVPALVILALTGIVLVGQGPLGNVLLGTGRHRLVAWVSLGEALANLVLSLILVRPLGIVGVAIGTGVPVLIANLGILLPAACRAVDVRVGTFAGQVLLAPAVGAVPAIAVCVLLREVLPPTSLLMVVGEAAVTGLVYLACVVGGGLGREARERYLKEALALVRFRRTLPSAT